MSLLLKRQSASDRSLLPVSSSTATLGGLAVYSSPACRRHSRLPSSSPACAAAACQPPGRPDEPAVRCPARRRAACVCLPSFMLCGSDKCPLTARQAGMQRERSMPRLAAPSPIIAPQQRQASGSPVRTGDSQALLARHAQHAPLHASLPALHTAGHWQRRGSACRRQPARPCGSGWGRCCCTPPRCPGCCAR